MKKTAIIFAFLLLAGFAHAACEDYKMDIAEVHKNESCYTLFSAVFQDIGCEYNCFSDVSGFEVKQGGRIIGNSSGVITTYYGATYRSIDCSADDVSLIVYPKNSPESCNKDFLLSKEYQEWINYISNNQSSQAESASSESSAALGPLPRKASRDSPEKETLSMPIPGSIPEQISALGPSAGLPKNNTKSKSLLQNRGILPTAKRNNIFHSFIIFSAVFLFSLLLGAAFILLLQKQDKKAKNRK